MDAKGKRNVLLSSGWQYNQQPLSQSLPQPPILSAIHPGAAHQYFFPRTENYYHRMKPGTNGNERICLFLILFAYMFCDVNNYVTLCSMLLVNCSLLVFYYHVKCKRPLVCDAVNFCGVLQMLLLK